MSVRILTDADGAAAALHDLGGDGPPLLLTHGNGLNAGMWATVVPSLRAHFRCFGLDFRGHGASPTHDDAMAIERHWLEGEVLAAVQAVGGAPIVAAGHSLGGATLLRTEQHHPGTFAALWVFEPVLVPPDWPTDEGPSALIEASRRRRIDFDSVEDALGRFRSKPPFKVCEEAAVRAYVEIGTYPGPEGGVRLSCSGEVEARIFESNERRPLDELAAVTCPVVVARGLGTAAGNDLPPRVAPLIADALPNATLQEFDGVTHFAPMEAGAVIGAAMVAHLTGR
jgi:pimeloyl-ACP methyl ester carboxylesterase